MIAGLLSNSSQNTITKMPGAGDIPILGSLFRSTEFRKGETELVIVVTPYLVNPVDANSIVLPTDGYKTPGDIQRVLGNMLSDGDGSKDRPKPSASGDATGPKVGDVGDVAPPAPEGRNARRSGQTASAAPAATAPTPGFSLN